MATTKVEFEIRSELNARIDELWNMTTHPDRKAFLVKLMEEAVYQREYRSRYNVKKNAEMKEAKQLMKMAQRDPELAVKLGLGTRR